MRIIIFTDSLGRPRPDIDEKEKTLYKDVYGYKLKENFKLNHEIDLIYIESLDTEDAIYWAQRMVAFREPDLVIFHLGINDCVPRLFKKNNRSLFFNKFFRKLTFDFFLKLFSYFRYTITKLRKIVYVEKDKFKENINIMREEILKYNSKCKFVCVSIAKSDFLNNKSFDYNNNIIEYNEILKDIFDNEYIEINKISHGDTGLISDCIHITKETHEKVYTILKEKIERMDNLCAE